MTSTSVSYNKTLGFAGTLEPAFALTVVRLPINSLVHFCKRKDPKLNLNNRNPEANEEFSAILSEFLQSKLNIPNDRGYMLEVFFLSRTLLVLKIAAATFATRGGDT